MKKRILVILSGSDRLNLKDGKIYNTGFYLNELMVPVKKMLDNGFELVFANPEGTRPFLDKGSDSPAYFGNNEEQHKNHKDLLEKLKILSITESPVNSFKKIIDEGLDRFDGLFVPGGHAPMEDLADNEELGSIFRHFNEKAKPTALVCHGPVALLSAIKNASGFMKKVKDGSSAEAKAALEDWPYAGYDMTVFSTDEENAVSGERGIGGFVQFDPQSTLELAGGKMKQGHKMFENNVVVCKELVTGQNPASDEELAENFIKMINK